EASVAINNWRGPFFDLVQLALTKPGSVPPAQLFEGCLVFIEISGVAVVVYALTRFFVSHYTFRWRTAMNDYYMARWSTIRVIEGASQRVQDDTMRFSSTMESLGADFVESIMKLIAFLPILLILSTNVVELPVVGEVPHSLVMAAIAWSLFGTAAL